MFAGTAFARIEQENPNPSFVDTINNPYAGSWGGDIYKMYDPYANIVCYETQGSGSDDTYGISCLSLN